MVNNDFNICDRFSALNCFFQSEVETKAYVNASYIKAPVYDIKGKASSAKPNSPSAYIAAQGPMPSTVADFLTMVYEQKSPQIVMLCQYV